LSHWPESKRRIEKARISVLSPWKRHPEVFAVHGGFEGWAGRTAAEQISFETPRKSAAP
jgi:hypothetical protein